MNDASGPLLGTPLLAEELGVDRDTITKWVERNPPGSAHPCPKPTETDMGRALIRGWRRDQVPEWRAWRQVRHLPISERFAAQLELMEREEPGAVARVFGRDPEHFQLLTSSQKAAVRPYLAIKNGECEDDR